MVAFVTRSEEPARLRDLYDTLIESELAEFVSHSFEDLCNAALRTLYPEYTITDTGHWLYGDHEIDVVGLTAGETLLVGECKFQQSALGYDGLASLERHADELRWTPQNGTDSTVEYALFSRTGFKQSVREAASGRDDFRLFTATDVVNAHTDSET